MGLPYLHQPMRVWGHPYGLNVTLMDPDVVSGNNCVRQPFAISDIGQREATMLVNRIKPVLGIELVGSRKSPSPSGLSVAITFRRLIS